MVPNLDRLRGIPADTSPKAARVQFMLYRKMGEEGRSRLMAGMDESLSMMLADGVRERHPDYAPEQVRMAVIRLRLGKDLFRKAFPGVDVKP